MILKDEGGAEVMTELLLSLNRVCQRVIFLCCKIGKLTLMEGIIGEKVANERL